MDPSIQVLKGSLQTTRAYKQGLVKMKEADWAMLESKLSQWGFENPNQLCHAIVAGQFPKQQRSEQVEKLLDRIRVIKVQIFRASNHIFIIDMK